MNSKGINRMRNLKKLVLFAAILGICGGWAQSAFAQVERKGQPDKGQPPETMATARCWCLLSCANLTNQKVASFVCKDYGAIWTYTGLNPQNDSNQTDCNTRCTTKAAPDTNSQAVATQCCNIAKCPNASTVRAWSKVGTKEYKSAQQIGGLTNTPPVVQVVTPGMCNF